MKLDTVEEIPDTQVLVLPLSLTPCGILTLSVPQLSPYMYKEGLDHGSSGAACLGGSWKGGRDRESHRA